MGKRATDAMTDDVPDVYSRLRDDVQQAEATRGLVDLLMAENIPAILPRGDRRARVGAGTGLRDCP